MRIDEYDLAILRMLQKNSRMSLKYIAESLGKAPSFVEYRLSRLKANAIIKKFALIVEPEKLGFDHSTIIMARIIPRMRRELEEFIRSKKNVLAAYLITGPYDICMLAVFRDRREFLNFVEEMFNRGFVSETMTLIVVDKIKEEFELPI